MHLTYVAPGLVLLLVGIVGNLRRPASVMQPDLPHGTKAVAGEDEVEHRHPEYLGPRPMWTPLAWRSGLVVTAVLWWPLAINQLVPSSSQGNLLRIYRTTRLPRTTRPLQAIDYVGHALLTPPKAFGPQDPSKF